MPEPNPEAANVISPAPDPQPSLGPGAQPIAQQPTPQLPTGVAGMGGQTPLSANVPQNAQPLSPNAAHSLAVGHGFKSLMSGFAGTHPVPNPDGTVTQAPNSARQMFAGILSGAIAGMAAGADSPQNGWAAAAKGAGAAQQQRQQQTQEAQKQAQQQLQNQQEQDKNDREKQLVDAQVAHMHAETVASQHLNDLQDKKYHDEHNAAAQAMINTLTDAGGVAPVDGALPANLSAVDLRDAYTQGIKNGKNIRNAPDGYVRHFFDKTDSSELTWDDKAGNWVQADGTPANMTDKTMVSVLDVPREAMKTKRPVSGKDINTAAGLQLVDPDKTYPMAPIDMDALNTRRLGNENEAARTKAQERSVRAQEVANQREQDRQRQAEYTDMYNQVKESNMTLESRQKEITNPADPAYKALSDQIDANNQRLLDKYNEVHPSKTPSKSVDKVPPPPETGVPAIINKYAQTLRPEVATIFQAAAKSGKPASEILQGIASDPTIPPTDKVALSEAYQKFQKEAAPVQAASQQASSQANSTVQAAANDAWKAEHPYSAAVTYNPQLR